MRADQPVCAAAAPTVSESMPTTLTQLCQGSRLPLFAGSIAPVPILEPDDVVELRRRDLDDRRVFERLHAVDGSGRDPEGRSGADDLHAWKLFPGLGHLELGTAGVDTPGLVLLPMELEAEGLARLDEEQLAAIVVGQRPDQLVAPRLVDLDRLHGERLELAEVRKTGAIAHAFAAAASQSGLARRCSTALRRSFGVLTVSQTPSWR